MLEKLAQKTTAATNWRRAVAFLSEHVEEAMHSFPPPLPLVQRIKQANRA
jgi:hypothetical protein